MKKRMNKNLIVLSVFFLSIFLFVITGCPDATGLHNQQASQVTIKFINFETLADGEYSVPGGFLSKDDWDISDYVYTDSMITIKDGEGTTNVTQTCILREFDFTLVPVGSWLRPWFPTITGNASDPTNANKYWNFGVWATSCGAITLGIPATVIVDGSTNPVTLTLEQ